MKLFFHNPIYSSEFLNIILTPSSLADILNRFPENFSELDNIRM